MRNISELIQRAWPLSVFGEKESDKPELKEKIKNLLKQQNAVIIAHYYTRPSVQELAEETGGIVADSLDMAKFGKNREFKKLIIAGVKFMAETAKILSPEKKVFIPNERATCSLDLGCDYEDFSKFIESYKDKEVVVYANTSAKIKSLASWVVTSSNAVSIVNHLKEKGREIIWAPDKNLGSYIKEKTHAKMIIWDGSCLVHEEFDAGAIKKMLTDTSVACLVHPESSKEVLALADVVGSTSELLKASIKMPQTKFIVATDKGVIYQMKKASGEKIFIPAPTFKKNEDYYACGKCPWMQMNILESILDVLENEKNEIILDEKTRRKAQIPLERMINFKKNERT